MAGAVRGFPSAHIPNLFYAKGSYFALTGATPFSRLIYPVPEVGGLGVHMTLDTTVGSEWGKSSRINKLIFIGKNLDREALNEGFRSCLA